MPSPNKLRAALRLAFSLYSLDFASSRTFTRKKPIRSRSDISSAGDAIVPRAGSLCSSPAGSNVSVRLGGRASVLAQCDDITRIFVNQYLDAFES